MISSIVIPIRDPSGSLSYPSTDGMFFTYDARCITSLEGCRELFGTDWSPRQRNVGFLLKGISAQLVSRFFETVETRLGLVDRTEVHRVRNATSKVSLDDEYHFDAANVLVLRLAPFWMSNVTNREIFTLFLRCAAVYYKGNLNRALEAYTLMSDVRYAIDWFLAGNTKPTYDQDELFTAHNGFVDYFGPRKKAHIRQMLVKPGTRAKRWSVEDVA